MLDWICWLETATENFCMKPLPFVLIAIANIAAVAAVVAIVVFGK